MLSRRLRELARTQIEMFERGERNGARGLHDHLVLLEHEQDHLVDIALGDLHEVVEELVEQREREIAGTTHRHALRRRDHLVGRHHMAGVERPAKCRRTLGDRADHAHLGAEHLHGERDASTQTAATKRHDDVGDTRNVFENLHGNGALPAQHLIIVERRHVDHALTLAQLDRVGRGLVEHIAVQHDVGPIRLRRVHLERRRDLRHQNRRLRPTLMGRIGDALRMVACRGGDNTALELLVGERGDLVVSAANLE